MKKLIISTVVFVVFFSVWAAKYYSLNNGFHVWHLNPQENYSMHQKIDIGDNLNYAGEISKGYSVCIEKAYIIDTKKLLSEIGKESNMLDIADSSIVLDLVVYHSDSDAGLQLSGMPLIGSEGNYSTKSWNSLDEQVIWLGISCRPLDQRIKINLDKL